MKISREKEVPNIKQEWQWYTHIFSFNCVEFASMFTWFLGSSTLGSIYFSLHISWVLCLTTDVVSGSSCSGYGWDLGQSTNLHGGVEEGEREYSCLAEEVTDTQPFSRQTVYDCHMHVNYLVVVNCKECTHVGKYLYIGPPLSNPDKISVSDSDILIWNSVYPCSSFVFLYSTFIQFLSTYSHDLSTPSPLLRPAIQKNIVCDIHGHLHLGMTIR